MSGKGKSRQFCKKYQQGRWSRNLHHSHFCLGGK